MSIERQLEALWEPAPPTVATGALLGVGLVDGYRIFDSPVGEVVVAFNAAGVSAVDLADGDVEERFRGRFGRPLVPARPPRGWEERIGRAIERGTPGDLPVDLRSVTPFQRTVLEVTATIPKGQVRSYGWLARAVGSPRAVRAVGTALARNPVPLIIPCHRVVRTDGRLGAYSLGGPDRKRRLLFHEGADPDRLERLAARGVRFVGSDTTGVFCLPTCRHARRIGDRHRIEFGTDQEAVAAGFRPCRICRPA